MRGQVIRRVLSPGGVVAHVGVILVCGTILVLANAIGAPGQLWFWRPLLLLGALLALHAVVIIAAGRTSRLRVAAAWLGALPARLWALRPAWSIRTTVRAGLRAHLQRWERALQPAAEAGPVPLERRPTSQAAPVPIGEVAGHAAFGSWPAASPAAPLHSAQPEPAPAWAASWPMPTVAKPAPPIRSTGSDSVLNGAQIAHPEDPRWDQLEVAAASWLAHRSAESAPAEAMR